jgi:hypothetical protein
MLHWYHMCCNELRCQLPYYKLTVYPGMGVIWYQGNSGRQQLRAQYYHASVGPEDRIGALVLLVWHRQPA